MKKLAKALKNPNKAINFIGKKLNRELSWYIYGNDSRISGNIASLMAKKRAEILSDVKKNDYEKGLLNRGFYDIGVQYEKEVISNVKKKFEKLIHNNEIAEVRKYRGNVYNRKISSKSVDISEHFTEVCGLLTEKVKNLIECHYRSNFRVVKIKAWRNYHIPSQFAKSESPPVATDWHCDTETPEHIKLFVYLNDVSEDHGPFHLVGRNKSKEIIRKYMSIDKSPKGNIEDKLGEENITKFTGPAGSAGICNTHLHLHRAGLPKKGNHRDIVQLQFAPTPDPLPKDWIDQPELYSHDKYSQWKFRRYFSY